MSSNQNNGDIKKVSSIRNKLAMQRTLMKIGFYFGQSVLLWFVMMFVWFGAIEHNTVGKIDFKNYSRGLKSYEKDMGINNPDDLERVVKNFRFEVKDKEKDVVIISLPIKDIGLKFGIFCAVLFVFNLTFSILGHSNESERIKKVLKPLSDLAVRVEQLSRFEYSEEKYHLIEEKITSMTPDDNEKLVLGDEELEGIENAMNNLLMRIRESNRQQARFVNDASHELRTPIAVIEGYANMLARWGREDEKVLDESINAIVNESEHMKHLVEQLLFLARGDAGRTVVNPTKVSLSDMMREVYEESLMIDEEHIYRFNSPDDKLFVMADEGLLKQAVRILVDNAAKYTAAKDEIVLSAGYKDSEKGTVYLRVQDTGIGMKDADIEHMFERFYRSDEARSYGGTGLGLSIAKWIVDKHDGYFEILSREDLGTRIEIIFKQAI